MRLNFYSRDPRLVGLIFAVVGTIFCVVAIIIFINTVNSLQGTITTQGQIISCEMVRTVNSNNNSVSYTCKPTVRFTTANGEKIDFVSSFSSSNFQEGDEVPVNYHPDHPHNAFISSFIGLWLLPLILGGLGAIFVVIGLLLLGFGILRRGVF